ncbi:cyclin-dependent kinase inhibitor 1Ca [Oreochromis aureus]|uniref:Cyclin-dependent kinase inhibitor domain-containing protein n=1 Tax=Oreochromis aureus TaxID=47969 RepID=A0A668VY99_OREAU|nr:cyclin-dependent kinase inhibitor 1Ca [Oreochromis aureus]
MEPIRRRESVCRALFGPVDHNQLRRDLKLKLKEIIEQDSRRWNFNFECETPLPGRFQWDEVPVVCTTAEPARPKDDPHGSSSDRPSDGEDGAGADQENCSNITNKRKSPAEKTLHRRKRTLSKPAASHKYNARITDYFAKRRRTTTTKSIPNHFHVGSHEAALRKTLR